MYIYYSNVKFSYPCAGNTRALFRRRVFAPVSGAIVLSFVFSSSASGATDLVDALVTLGTVISAPDSNGYLNGNFELTRNIVLTKSPGFDTDFTYEITSPGTDFRETVIDNDSNLQTVFGSFSGILNGKGFTISNLDVPLFNDLVAATVTNLNLITDENGISGTGTTGILARTTNKLSASDPETADSTTLIDNVHTDGIVESPFAYTGGIIGENNSGAITNSSNSADVTSTNHKTGGLTGSSAGARIFNSNSSGTITGIWNVGGLVGDSSDLSFERSFSSGNVNGVYGTGGLVGNHGIGTLVITDSYSTAELNGTDAVGGLVGILLGGTIKDSAFLGEVNGSSDVGGIAGNLDSLSEIENTHSAGNVTGYSNIGGLVGMNSGTIKNSLTTGSVGGTGYQVGGAVGFNASSGHLENIISTGDVLGPEYIGGLVGANSGHIVNSIANGNVGDVTSTQKIGGLVGYGSSGSIESSFATGNVLAAGAGQVGGFVGYSENVTYLNSVASGEVRGGSSVGGFIGSSRYDSITASTASGNVNGNTWLGGFIGTSDTSRITNSSATGATGNPIATEKVGGLIGYAYGSYGDYTVVQNSSSTGNVLAENAIHVGGLIGASDLVNVANSQATGDVSGTNQVGGLVGYSSNDLISNSKATGNVTGYQTVGGFIGDLNRSSISNSASAGTVSRNSEGGNYLGTFLGTNAYGSITSSTSISNPSEPAPTFPYIGNDLDWTPVEPESYSAIGLSSSRTYLAIPTNPLTTLNHGPGTSGWAKDVNSYINSGKPYLNALLDSGFYSDTTPDPDPIDPEEPSGGGSSGGGSGSIKKPISPEEIAKREGSERKILESLKENFRKIEVEDFKSAGIVGVTDKSLPIVVELLAELEIQTFEAPTVQKVVQIAGAISRIISVDQGKSISFIDLKKVGVTEIEYSELKEFSNFLALLPADKKNSIKEIQLLVAEFKKNKEVAIKAREAKKEATRIQREKNLQLILSMFNK